MQEDPFINRFTILVLLFVASINILIFIPHFMALLLGWDGLGITSFVLVIYYQNPKSLGAGIITALTNRIGDVILLISIALTLNQGHWNILHIWHSQYLWPQVLTILAAACTKSAQIPFSRWLPAAIAAPTPVSALVHSSTLVTGGVFLLIRFFEFLNTLYIFKPLLLIIAVSTIFITGISAITECDIKKIIALSTLSQLGVIIAALGLGLPNLATFHIITHALFKALLFICAGEVIACHHHAQELRWIGNLISQTPVASSCILAANFALCGIPFIAGFYSKDLILEIIIFRSQDFIITSLTLIAARFTTLYSIRFSIATLWGPRTHISLRSVNEPQTCIIPIISMTTLSVIGGAIILWIMPNPISLILLSPEIKSLPLIIITLGILIGVFIIKNSKRHSTLITKHIFNYARCIIWFLVPISTQLQLKAPILLRHHLLKTVDHSWLELARGQGINKSLTSFRTLIIFKSPKTPTHTLLIILSIFLGLLYIPLFC